MVLEYHDNNNNNNSNNNYYYDNNNNNNNNNIRFILRILPCEYVQMRVKSKYRVETLKSSATAAHKYLIY